MSDSKIKELFGRYGDVLDLDPHTTDSSIVYVVSDPPHCILNSLSLPPSPSLSLSLLADYGCEGSRRGGGQFERLPDFPGSPSSGREIRKPPHSSSKFSARSSSFLRDVMSVCSTHARRHVRPRDVGMEHEVGERGPVIGLHGV